MSEVKYPAHIVGLCQEILEEQDRKKQASLWLILADALEEAGMPWASRHVRGHGDPRSMLGNPANCTHVLRRVLNGKSCMSTHRNPLIEVPNA